MDNLQESNLLYSFEVPIYYFHRKKNMLLGFNQVIPLHPFSRNKIKQWFNGLIAEKLSYPERYDGAYTVEYELWYSHKRIDASNVIGIIEKFSLDGLQECGAILNDNINCHVGSVYKIGGLDKDNPHVKIKVYKED